MTMPAHYTASGPAPGPHLLVFGAIHGNEICGPKALAPLIEDLKSGKLCLTRGRLTLIPIANPLAHERGTRFVNVDLNRVFSVSPSGFDYEDGLVAALTDHLRSADVLLDLHSAGAQTPPFAFLDFEDAQSTAFARALGLGHIVTGWQQIYDSPEAKGLKAGDTQSMAHALGKPGVVVECGSHSDPDAPEIARQVTLRAMAHFGLIAEDAAPRGDEEPQFIRMRKVIKRPKGAELAAPWQNFSPVERHAILAKTQKGNLTAPFKGLVILPKPDAEVGKEWFYLGEVEDAL